MDDHSKELPSFNLSSVVPFDSLGDTLSHLPSMYPKVSISHDQLIHQIIEDYDRNPDAVDLENMATMLEATSKELDMSFLDDEKTHEMNLREDDPNLFKKLCQGYPQVIYKRSTENSYRDIKKDKINFLQTDLQYFRSQEGAAENASQGTDDQNGPLERKKSTKILFTNRGGKILPEKTEIEDEEEQKEEVAQTTGNVAPNILVKYNEILEKFFETVDKQVLEGSSEDNALLAVVNLRHITKIRTETELVSSLVGDDDLNNEMFLHNLKRLIDLMEIRLRRTEGELMDSFSEDSALMGMEASLICTCIMAIKNIPRIFILEDILHSVVGLLRSGISSIIHASSVQVLEDKNLDEGGYSDDVDLLKTSIPRNKKSYSKHDKNILRLTCLLMDKICSLLRHERNLADSLIVQVTSTAFYCLEHSDITSVSLSVFTLLITIYEFYEDYRSSLLDDLFHCASKTTSSKRTLRGLRLKEGHVSIRVSSGIFLNFIAISAIPGEAPLTKNESEKDTYRQCMRTSYSNAMKFCEDILKCCFQKQIDPEKKLALQSFVEDILSVFGIPEWPSAAIILKSLSIQMMRALTALGRDATTSGFTLYKSLILELLGNVSSSILKIRLAAKESNTLTDKECSRILVQGLKEENELVAAEFWKCLFIIESNEYSEQCVTESSSRTDMLNCTKLALNKLDIVARGFDAIVEGIIGCLKDPFPTIRAKSIRSLAAIANMDPKALIDTPSLRSAITLSCMDMSTSVREASLDVLSRLFVFSNKNDAFLESVFPITVNRLLDTSTSVRKRAVHIFKSLVVQSLNTIQELKKSTSIKSVNEIAKANKLVANICSKLYNRLDDVEVSVKEAAEATILYATFGYDKLDNRADKLQNFDAKVCIRRLVDIFTLIPGVDDKFLRRILYGHFLELCLSRFPFIIDSLIAEIHDIEEGLVSVQAADRENFMMRKVACASLLEEFSIISPALLSVHCEMLAPDLKEPVFSNRYDVLYVKSLLGILEHAIPAMKIVSSNFIEELAHDVEVLICTNTNAYLAESAVKCFCVIAKSRENLSQLPSMTLKQYIDFLESKRSEVDKSLRDNKDLSGVLRNASVALLRLGLFGRYYTIGDVLEEQFFSLFVDYYTILSGSNWECEGSARHALQESALRGLMQFLMKYQSYLPKASPVLCDALKGPNNLQLRVLFDVHDLIMAENVTSFDYEDVKNLEQKPLASEEDKTMAVLVGFTQALLPHINREALSDTVDVRFRSSLLMQILVLQGFVLPALIVPNMLALMADREDRRCRENASKVLAFIAQRFPHMLYSKMFDGIKASFVIAKKTLSNRPFTHIASTDQFNKSLLSPAIYLLSKANRKTLVQSLVGHITQRCDTISHDTEEQELYESTIYIILTLAYLEYGGNPYIKGNILQQTVHSQPTSSEISLKNAREEVLLVIHEINKFLSNTGEQSSVRIKEVLTQEDVNAARLLVPKAFHLSALLLLKQYLKIKRWEGANKPSDEFEAEEEIDQKSLPFIDLSKLVNDEGPIIPKTAKESFQILLYCRELIKKDEIEEAETELFASRKTSKRKSLTPRLKRKIKKKKRHPFCENSDSDYVA